MWGNVQHGLILTKELAFIKLLNCLASTHYLPNSTNGLRMSSKKFQDCTETTFKQCAFFYQSLHVVMCYTVMGHLLATMLQVTILLCIESIM
jgi:hypothetical protein